MNCDDVQVQLLHASRRLDPALEDEVRAHVDACAACRSAERAERALDELLEQRLPRYTAPLAFKRRLGLRLGTPYAARRGPARWARIAGPALAASIALVAGGALLQRTATSQSEVSALTSELVNDHLRVLAQKAPVDIESGVSHQVKPWFQGRLDFAPVVPSPESGELRLRGGSVGYVFDRKAAVLVYSLRLHVVTLLVFRAGGLPWPERGARQIGPVSGRETSSRGFHVVLWRDGDLGYALVSDAGAQELSGVAGELADATVRQPAP